MDNKTLILNLYNELHKAIRKETRFEMPDVSIMLHPDGIQLIIHVRIDKNIHYGSSFGVHSSTNFIARCVVTGLQALDP